MRIFPLSILVIVSGVSLGNAMETSTNGNSAPVPISQSADDGTTRRTNESNGGGSGKSVLDDDDTKAYLMADVAYQVPFHSDIQGITRLSAPLLLIENNRVGISLYLGGGTVDLKSGSLLDQTVSNPWMLEAGFGFRYYFNSRHVFFSPYVALDLNWRTFIWDYRNPNSFDGVGTDWAFAVNGYGGLGIAVHRGWRWTCYAEVGIGATGFAEEKSFEGFRNDITEGFGYFSAKVGIGLRF